MVNTLSWKPGSEVLPDFVVQRELGRGGMGSVLLVEYRPTGQQYAVKTAIFSDTKTRQRFMAELRRWHDLAPNPSLVRCYFSREVENRVHVFAEYVRGGSLEQWIREGWISSVPEMLDVSIQLARALHTIHQQKLVHQDVKPQNVLIGNDGTVKLTDFGLAQTTGYRSPEQASSGQTDARTDQWSWALTVLFMFSGERTWGAGEAGALALEDYLANLDDREQQRVPMPFPLAATLKRALEEDPAKRWPTMAAIAIELADFHRLRTNSPYVAGTLAARAKAEDNLDVNLDSSETPGSKTVGSWADFRDDSSAYLQSRSIAAELDAVVDEPAEGQSREAQTVEQLHRYDEVQHQAEARWNEDKRDLAAFETLLSAYEKKAALHHRNGDLRKAIDYLQRVAELIDAAPQSTRDKLLETQADIHRKCGLLLAELGEYETALQSVNKASPILDRLRTTVSTVVIEERWNRVALLDMRVHANRGFILHQSGRTVLALDALKQAISHAIETLLPTMPELRSEVAKIHIRRGMIERTERELDKADAALQKAVALITELPDADHFLSQKMLADVLMWQGIVQSDRNEPFRAAKLLEQSIDIQEKRVLPHDVILARIGLAQCNEIRGLVAENQGDWLTANIYYASAAKTWDLVVHEHGRSEYTDRLAIAMWRELNARNQRKIEPSDKLPMARRLFEHLVQRQGRTDLAKYPPLLGLPPFYNPGTTKPPAKPTPKLSLTENEEPVRTERVPNWDENRAVPSPKGKADVKSSEIPPRPTPRSPSAKSTTPALTERASNWETIRRSLPPLSPEDEVGLSSDRAPVLFEEGGILSDEFPLPSFPMPPSFEGNVFGANEAIEEEDEEEYDTEEDEAFNALDGPYSTQHEQRQRLVHTRRSWVPKQPPRPKQEGSLFNSLSDDEIARVLGRDSHIPPSDRAPISRRTWVPPKNLSSPPTNEALLPKSSAENSLSKKTNSPTSIVGRARFLPALVMALFAGIAVVVLRLRVQPSVATNAVSLLGAAFFLYMMHIAWDGFNRRRRGISSYTLTHEEFHWSDSVLADPIRLPLREITKIELMPNRVVVLTAKGRIEPYRITPFGFPPLREMLIRPTAGAVLFDALRSRVRKANRTASVVDARTRERDL